MVEQTNNCSNKILIVILLLCSVLLKMTGGRTQEGERGWSRGVANLFPLWVLGEAHMVRGGGEGHGAFWPLPGSEIPLSSLLSAGLSLHPPAPPTSPPMNIPDRMTTCGLPEGTRCDSCIALMLRLRPWEGRVATWVSGGGAYGCPGRTSLKIWGGLFNNWDCRAKSFDLIPSRHIAAL